ncbi:hypothetical protein SNEBB_004150 [Seison nebaliae]|nr:hypothetical protein SNEBB_004150 [Seison nebaliae]
MFRLLVVLLCVTYFCSATKYCRSPPKFALDANTKVLEAKYDIMILKGVQMAHPEGTIIFECLPGFKFRQTGDTKMTYECDGNTGMWKNADVGTNRNMDCRP